MTNPPYRSVGKQVLRGRDDVAQACSVETAQMIVDALNDRYAQISHDFSEIRDGDIVTFQFEGNMTKTVACGYLEVTPDRGYHSVRQENDEYACSCGARWDVSEGIDHP